MNTKPSSNNNEFDDRLKQVASEFADLNLKIRSLND